MSNYEFKGKTWEEVFEKYREENGLPKRTWQDIINEHVEKNGLEHLTWKEIFEKYKNDK